MLGFEEVEKYDPELAQAMSDELTRQRTHIELIASENIVSEAVMLTMGKQSRYGSNGQRSDKQICRGLSGKTLLWWMRIC